MICTFLQVCAAENAQIQALLMDRVIEYCQRDIRKTIMHLQFWCQGQNSKKGNVCIQIGMTLTTPHPFDPNSHV